MAALNIGRDNFDKRGNDLGRHVGVGVGYDAKRVARLQTIFINNYVSALHEHRVLIHRFTITLLIIFAQCWRRICFLPHLDDANTLAAVGLASAAVAKTWLITLAVPTVHLHCVVSARSASGELLCRVCGDMSVVEGTSKS